MNPVPFSRLTVILLLFAPQLLWAQQSGRVFEFLSLPTSARITAMGGYAVPTADTDLETALVFPSLLRPELSNLISMNFADYFADIQYGTLAFGRHFEGVGTFSASLQYIDYGRFIEADETGQIIGEFTAGETGFTIGWGRALNERLSIGSNIKFIHSSLDQATSAGVAVDVSLSYLNPENRFAAGILARNFGRQIFHFRENNPEPLPFDLIIGVSQRLQRAPLRFSLVLHNLHQFDLSYDPLLPQPELLPGQTPDGQSAGERVSAFADKLARHVVVGAEFLPSPNFSLHFGYNYRRRQEMQVESRVSTVGFSWGFGVRIYRFRFSYGRATYHLAGATNHFTITTKLDELFGGGPLRSSQLWHP